MRTVRWVALLGAVSVLGAACSTPPSTSDEASASMAEKAFRPTATVQDIMDGIIDPSADELWNSVATVIGPEGVVNEQPETEEDWQMVRYDAIRLVEATNLLLMDGRHIAAPGVRSENPDVELQPEEIEERVAAEPDKWVELVHGLHDAASVALKATEAKDADGLLNAGEGIDTACENCHVRYWYPNQVIPNFDDSQG